MSTGQPIDLFFKGSRLVYPGKTDIVVIPPKLTNAKNYQEYWNGIKGKVSCIVNLSTELISDKDDLSNFYYKDLSLFTPQTKIYNPVDACYTVYKNTKNTTSVLDIDIFSPVDKNYVNNLRILHIPNLTEEGPITTTLGSTENNKVADKFTQFDIIRLMFFMKLAIEYSDQYNKTQGRKKLPILVHCNAGLVRTSLAITLILFIYYGNEYKGNDLVNLFNYIKGNDTFAFISQNMDPILYERVKAGSYFSNGKQFTNRFLQISTEKTLNTVVLNPRFQNIVYEFSTQPFAPTCYQQLLKNLFRQYYEICLKVKESTQGNCPKKWWSMSSSFKLYVLIEVKLQDHNNQILNLIIEKDLYKDCNDHNLYFYLDDQSQKTNITNVLQNCQTVTIFFKQKNVKRVRSGNTESSMYDTLIQLFNQHNIDYDQIFRGNLRMNSLVCCRNNIIYRYSPQSILSTETTPLTLDENLPVYDKVKFYLNTAKIGWKEIHHVKEPFDLEYVLQDYYESNRDINQAKFIDQVNRDLYGKQIYVVGCKTKNTTQKVVINTVDKLKSVVENNLPNIRALQLYVLYAYLTQNIEAPISSFLMPYTQTKFPNLFPTTSKDELGSGTIILICDLGKPRVLYFRIFDVSTTDNDIVRKSHYIVIRILDLNSTQQETIIWENPNENK